MAIFVSEPCSYQQQKSTIVSTGSSQTCTGTQEKFSTDSEGQTPCKEYKPIPLKENIFYMRQPLLLGLPRDVSFPKGHSTGFQFYF